MDSTGWFLFVCFGLGQFGLEAVGTLVRLLAFSNHNSLRLSKKDSIPKTLSSAFIPGDGSNTNILGTHIKASLGPEALGSHSNYPPSFVEREQVVWVCVHA